MLLKIFFSFLVSFFAIWGLGHFVTLQMIKDNAWTILKVILVIVLAVDVILVIDYFF
jgi:hypothetical protein